MQESYNAHHRDGTRAKKPTFNSREKLNAKTVTIKDIERILKEFAPPESPDSYGSRRYKFSRISAILVTQEKEKERKCKSEITQLPLFSGWHPNQGPQSKSPLLLTDYINAAMPTESLQNSVGDSDMSAAGIPSSIADNQSGGVVCFVSEPATPTPAPVPPEEEEGAGETPGERLPVEDVGEKNNKPIISALAPAGTPAAINPKALASAIGQRVTNSNPKYWPENFLGTVVKLEKSDCQPHAGEFYASVEWERPAEDLQKCSYLNPKAIQSFRVDLRGAGGRRAGEYSGNQHCSEIERASFTR